MLYMNIRVTKQREKVYAFHLFYFLLHAEFCKDCKVHVHSFVDCSVTTAAIFLNSLCSPAASAKLPPTPFVSPTPAQPWMVDGFTKFH